MEQIQTLPRNALKRLEFRRSGDNISVLYRPIHTYIKFVNNDEEGKEEIKKLCKMTRTEFAAFLKTVTGLPRITNASIEEALKSDNEKWYNGAWRHQTKKILDEIGIENVSEIPILGKEMDEIKE